MAHAGLGPLLSRGAEKVTAIVGDHCVSVAVYKMGAKSPETDISRVCHYPSTTSFSRERSSKPLRTLCRAMPCRQNPALSLECSLF